MIQKSRPDHAEVNERLANTAAVTAALKQAAHAAVQEHARAGKQIVVWRNGQIVWEDPSGSKDQPESSSTVQ